jgi:hypothetical protein
MAPGEAASGFYVTDNIFVLPANILFQPTKQI